MREKFLWIFAGTGIVLLMAATGWILGSLGRGNPAQQVADAPVASGAGAPAGAPGPESPAAAKFDDAMAKADAAYRSGVLKANQDYAAELQAQLQKAMQAGSLDEANRINDIKKTIDAQIASIKDGYPLTVEAAGPVVVASAGFNIKDGMNVDPRKPGYKLGALISEAGNADYGWGGPWHADGATQLAMAVADKAAASEGDAGLKFSFQPNPQSKDNYITRSLAKPIAGKLQIVQSIMANESSTTVVNCRTAGATATNYGPQWSIQGGEFRVIEGNPPAGTNSTWKQTGIPFNTGVWYTVTITADTDAQTWVLQVNDQTYKPDAPLHFRGSAQKIASIGWFTGNTVYIDAIKVIQLPK